MTEEPKRSATLVGERSAGNALTVAKATPNAIEVMLLAKAMTTRMIDPQPEGLIQRA
jgi:hypothetical protein